VSSAAPGGGYWQVALQPRGEGAAAGDVDRGAGCRRHDGAAAAQQVHRKAQRVAGVVLDAHVGVHRQHLGSSKTTRSFS